MAGLDAFTGRAFDMVASGAVRKALDLKNEDPRIRDRYKGVEQFLTARRLVEAGVGCVTLGYGGWDTHSQQLQDAEAAAAEAGPRHRQPDPGPARPRDGGRRGDGGVGRVRPHAEDQHADAGRDHWAPVMSALVAGGGLKMGQAIGATHGPRRVPEGPAVQGAAAAEHALPGDGHRPGDDVPERQRPADVHPRRPRAGQRAAVSGSCSGERRDVMSRSMHASSC